MRPPSPNANRGPRQGERALRLRSGQARRSPTSNPARFTNGRVGAALACPERSRRMPALCSAGDRICHHSRCVGAGLVPALCPAILNQYDPDERDFLQPAPAPQAHPSAAARLFHSDRQILCHHLLSGEETPAYPSVSPQPCARSALPYGTRPARRTPGLYSSPHSFAFHRLWRPAGSIGFRAGIQESLRRRARPTRAPVSAVATLLLRPETSQQGIAPKKVLLHMEQSRAGRLGQEP